MEKKQQQQQQQQHLFNGPLSRTSRVSRYQKGKTNLDLLEQEIIISCSSKSTVRLTTVSLCLEQALPSGSANLHLAPDR